MSGYLQRLAATVVGTERRVQPLVGGLFTKQPEQAIEEVATTIGPRTASSPISHLPASTRRTTALRASSAELEMEEASMPRESSPRPTLPTVEQNSIFASQYDERAERRESSARRREKPEAPERLVALSQYIERPANADIADKVQPLAGETESAEMGEPLRSTPLRPASAGPVRTFTRQAAAQPQIPSPVGVGGDDIQIHIGRIEVIAVPQQPMPRPVAAPVRRGPSLEDYLQRRDRRSR